MRQTHVNWLRSYAVLTMYFNCSCKGLDSREVNVRSSGVLKTLLDQITRGRLSGEIGSGAALMAAMTYMSYTAIEQHHQSGWITYILLIRLHGFNLVLIS